MKKKKKKTEIDRGENVKKEFNKCKPGLRNISYLFPYPTYYHMRINFDREK